MFGKPGGYLTYKLCITYDTLINSLDLGSLYHFNINQTYDSFIIYNKELLLLPTADFILIKLEIKKETIIF